MRKAAGSFYLAFFSISSPQCCHAAPSSRNQDVCAIDPSAIVSDACASFSTLDTLNAHLQPSIHSLTQTSDFFSYYRLNLYNKKCPFWSDESGMCGNIACAVNTIDNEEDVPPIWRAQELGKLEGPKAQHPNRKMQAERNQRPLMGELGADVGESCVVEYDDECDERDYCVPEDESAAAKGDYVSLVDNPERFTGYSGPAAHQVWEAIYRENCFSKGLSGHSAQSASSAQRSSPAGFGGSHGEAAQSLRNVMRSPQKNSKASAAEEFSTMLDDLELDDECLEKRVFYRIISGMHASISTHLCHDYLNQTTGQWGPNAQCYRNRLHNHPERVSNLYFNYAVLLRAIAKARRSLETYTFCSGDPVQDSLTKKKILGLAESIASGPNIYDESLMFQDDAIAAAGSLKEDFRSRFRNVSRTMDCVGCDKCRLWGKLQTAGYGTALKILFEFDEAGPSGANPPLRRTELVALVNTLDKVSRALAQISEFEEMLRGEAPRGRSSGFRASAQDHPANGRVENMDPDGLDESMKETPPQEKVDEEEVHEPTLTETFLHEFDTVWRAFKWVLRKWSEIPRTFLRIAVLEFGRVWAYWLGLEGYGRSWEIRKPSQDEL